MSKGISQTQQKILDHLRDYPMSNSLLIGYFALNIVPPPPIIHNGVIKDPSPVEFAKFHAHMQSLRRALRGLEARGLIVKTPDQEDRRKWCWQVTE